MSNVSTGNNPTSITLGPAGRYAYVTNADDDTVSVYSVDQTGSLALITTPNSFAAGASPYHMEIVSIVQ